MLRLEKLISDTLKSPNGKWSRKSLTMFVSFIISINLGTYIVISDYVLEKEINRYAIDVFNGFLILTGTLSGVTVWDKMSNKSKKEEDTHE
jgi:hypothetical protein